MDFNQFFVLTLMVANITRTIANTLDDKDCLIRDYLRKIRDYPRLNKFCPF